MPALGVSQETGTLLSWLKTEGETVTQGEPLMEVETDKATVEIEAPASGVLAQVTAAVGDKVPVGQTIALILAPGESPPARPKPPPKPAKATAPSPVEKPAVELRTAPLTGRIAASPAAKRIAREKGVDLSSLKGSGPQGEIVAEDVHRAAAAQPAAVGATPKVREVVPLSSMRRIVGERMARSKQSAPHFYVSIDVDMTELQKQREGRKKNGEKSVPSINDFILLATARALRDFPSLNATFTDQGVGLFSEINLGVAVALEEGLVVPVIRNADRLSLQEIGRQSRELAEKAQNKKLFPSDYEGGTFTVSNMGMFGVDSFVAIINPPQCAILAVGRVADRVVPRDGEIGIRPMMTMTLSADHRIVDGASAARFLKRVKELLEGAEFES